MVFFISVLVLVVFQRLSELVWAKRNERWMKERGAAEYGKSHYPWMVFIHISFFISLIIEVTFLHREPSSYWPVFLVIFLLVQGIRIWILVSMGRYWNTKIIVLPGSETIKKGPFRYMRHPNYFVVTIELAVLPLMFQAYWTAVLFFIFNQVILSVRIAEEEKALRKYTDYPPTQK
ncbi:isoprenylcysteine carboxyl methyltransferase family protein [Siminovitchia sediminis]|uniref:Isoprenylcysteine carboxyl methyltransferase family protein n=1 Tax=Siminovitchia sediminis TaxID=1274353 RepID=A0ABW4KLV8_9BACI